MLLFLVAGLLLGSIVGILLPGLGARLQIVSLGFVQAIKMIVIPLVFSAVTLGSYRLGASPGGMARLTLLAFGWFFFATFVAAMTGLTLDRIFQPGVGAHLHAAQAATSLTGAPVDWEKFWLGLIPSNVIAAMSEQKVLPTLIFAVLFGLSLAHIGERARPIVALLESLFDAIFQLTNWIVRLAPFAVFAVAAWFAATQSFSVLLALGKLVALMYLGLFIVVGLCLLALALMGRKPFSFARQMLDPVLVGVHLPRPTSFLAKSQLFENPRFAWLIHHGRNGRAGGLWLCQKAVDRINSGTPALRDPLC